MIDRKDCPMRSENGNCLPVGGFCTAVSEEYCTVCHNAYSTGFAAVRPYPVGCERTGRGESMNILVKDVKIPEIEENKSVKAEIRNLDGKLELGIMTGGYYCSQQWLYYPLAEAPEQKHGK